MGRKTDILAATDWIPLKIFVLRYVSWCLLLQDLGVSATSAKLQRAQDMSDSYAVLRLEPTATAVVRVSGGNIQLVKMLPGAVAAQIVPYNDKLVVVDVVKQSTNVRGHVIST